MLQFSINAGIAILITSLIITGYFTYLVGFKSFKTELIVFNAIFLFSSIFYNAIYFSIYFLNRTNEIKLEKEKSLKDKIMSELKDYKDKINPEFLYSSLETLISLSRKDTESADEFINKLSMVYRSILSRKRNEVVSAAKDIEVAKNLVSILNYKFHHNISLRINEDTNSRSIIPGTLIFIIQRIVTNSIISEIQPLKISVSLENDNLIVQHPVKDKIVTDYHHGYELDNLQKAYSFITSEKLQIEEKDKNRFYIIPTIKMFENESSNH
jgi:LytS/YehU family sensor histidine kinase